MLDIPSYVLTLQQALFTHSQEDFNALYIYRMTGIISTFVMESIKLAETFNAEIIAPHERPYLQDIHDRTNMQIQHLESIVTLNVFEHWREKVQTLMYKWQATSSLLLKTQRSINWVAVDAVEQQWRAAAAFKQHIEDYRKGYITIHTLYKAFQILQNAYLFKLSHIRQPWELHALLNLAETVIEQIIHTNNDFIQIVPSIENDYENTDCLQKI